MRRRDFLRDVAAGAIGGAALGGRVLAEPAVRVKPGEPFRLSSHGCGRATGYAEANKIVTVGGKTHVSWLDSVKEGFRVRVRTIDGATGTWSDTHTIGKAFDNHGGPALAVDGKGHLHVVYYPHHHPFRYRRSTRPNDASGWDEEVRFGKRCTYPTLMVGPDDALYLTCRESSKTQPWVVNLYVKKPDGDWRGPTAILRADGPKYAHFQEALAWGPDHRTLHLSTRMYGGGRTHTVGYMRSRDFGKTWEGSDGKRIDLPATSRTLNVIASDRGKKDPGLRCGAMAVDAAGDPHVLYSQAVPFPSRAWIASPDKTGRWQKSPLLEHLTKSLPGWCAAMPGGMTFGANGRIYVTLTAEPFDPARDTKPKGWGHVSKEVVLLASDVGGERFTARMISKRDPACAHWLPNIERPTGFNRVRAPSVIYTAGTRGEKNTQIVSNGVYWVGPPRE